MQDALQKAGFTEDYLAAGMVKGTRATEPTKKVIEDEDGTKRLEELADYTARARPYKLSAELLDAFPPKKQVNAEVGVEDVLDASESVDYSQWGSEDQESNND